MLPKSVTPMTDAKQGFAAIIPSASVGWHSPERKRVFVFVVAVVIAASVATVVISTYVPDVVLVDADAAAVDAAPAAIPGCGSCGEGWTLACSCPYV